MRSQLKALLLAAGFGTRLRPLTNSIPKCLVPIGGTPILGRWIDELEQVAVIRSFNTHYLANQVHNYVNHIQPRYHSKINISFEDELLGTGGTLLANRSFFADSTCLLIHADNATSADLQLLLNAHHARPKHCLLKMLTFNTNNPKSCGIVEVDNEGVVIKFHEKSMNPPGNQANGAVYVFDSSFLEQLSAMSTSFTDFSTHVIPKFLGQIYTWHTDSPYIDIIPQKI